MFRWHNLVYETRGHLARILLIERRARHVAGGGAGVNWAVHRAVYHMSCEGCTISMKVIESLVCTVVMNRVTCRYVTSVLLSRCCRLLQRTWLAQVVGIHHFTVNAPPSRRVDSLSFVMWRCHVVVNDGAQNRSWNAFRSFRNVHTTSAWGRLGSFLGYPRDSHVTVCRYPSTRRVSVGLMRLNISWKDASYEIWVD